MFYRRGLIERWGRDTNRVIESTVAAGKPEPEFAQIAGCTVVTFRFARALTPQVTGQVTGQVQVLLPLMKEDAKSRKELMDALQLRGRDNFEKLYLLPALEAGLIERTVPNKPNSRLQKYRLTDKGRALLA